MIFGDLVKPGDAARFLNVHPTTLGKWRREGLIESVEMPTGKSWRYRLADLQEMLSRDRLQTSGGNFNG